MADDGYEVKRGIIGKPKVAYKCAKCHNDLESDLTDAGKKDACPLCKAAFIVPGQRELNEIQDAAKQAEAEKTRKDDERRAAEAHRIRQREEKLRLEEEERGRREEEQLQLRYERAPLTPVQDLASNTIERGTIFPITRVFTLVIIGLLVLSWCFVIVRLLLPSESSGAAFLSEDPAFSALWNPKVLAGLAYTIITLVLIAVFALVLVLLAIERNTRPRTGSEVAQEVRGKE